jgi:ABC-type nitrate/sulfonate/bicarbonate transport system substrate-binding protein
MRFSSRRFGRHARGVWLLSALLVCASGATAASAASSKVPASTFKCVAPPVVNVGFAAFPGADFSQDFPIYAFGKQLEKVCHTRLNVEYLNVSSTAAVIAGSVMFAAGTTYDQISAYSQGEQTQEVQLAQQVQGGSTVYVAPSQYKSYGVGIKAVPKFAKLTWGVPFLNGATAIYYDMILKKDGISPSSVNLVVAGGNGAGALSSGKIQLLQQLDTFALVPLLASGDYYEVWNSSGLQAYQLAGFIPSGSLVTMRSTINKYPSLVQEMVDINVEAGQFMRKNLNDPKAIYDTYPAAAKALVPYSQFLGTWPQWRAAYAPLTGLLTLKQMQRAANLGYDYGFVPAQVKLPANQLDNTFLDNAYKSLGLPVPTTSLYPKLEYLMSNSEAAITGK